MASIQSSTISSTNNLSAEGANDLSQQLRQRGLSFNEWIRNNSWGYAINKMNTDLGPDQAAFRLGRGIQDPYISNTENSQCLLPEYRWRFSYGNRRSVNIQDEIINSTST